MPDHASREVTPVSTRPVVAAEPREVLGKQVNALRRQGLVHAVVYGHGRKSQAIQLDARAFDELLRTTTRNSLVDLKIGGGRAVPVLLQGIHEHPVRRHPIHADFFVVKMTEELNVDVPINYVGESHAVEKMGGTLLHLREHVAVRALPADLPHALDLDITSLDTFEGLLHVSDLVVPSGVTVVTDADEPLARVQPPRAQEEFAAVPGPEAAVPAAAETVEAAEASTAEDAG
jgi:large subunit ribosomal protein L25